MKKKYTFILGALLSIVTINISILVASKEAIAPLFSSPISYGITMDSTHNKFHSNTGNVAYDGNATIHTDLGNDIGFTYYQVKGLNSTWHVLGNGGYFYNTDPIHGMQSITLSFKTNNVSYSIYYSYDDSFGQIRNFTSSDTDLQVFNFNNDMPSYFKIVNNSGVNFNISSISIALSCQNEHPIVSICSENESMGTVSGGGPKIAGQNVTITATPNPGYRFIGWYDGENLVSINASYSFAAGNVDLDYVARFALENYNLIVETESDEKGSVSNSSGKYAYLSSITISATPNSGYEFDGWYFENNLVSNDNPYTFNMPHNNIKYRAKFLANSFDLALSNANPSLGEITGSGTFSCGSSVTITATPNTGVSFLGWYDTNDSLISSLVTYTFKMPYYDLKYTAKFEWTPYSVNISINNNSMGTVSGGGSYIYGQTVNLSATSNEHFSFYGWYDGDKLLSQESNYSFSMPNKSLNYEARFVQNYKLYLYSEDENKGTVSGPIEWGAGLEVTVNANANIGYAIDYWYDDDLNELSYESSYSFTMPSHDLSLYASFCTGYTLTVISSDITKGTVSGEGQYKAGRNVAIKMNHLSGIFKAWYNSENAIISIADSFVFTMPSCDYHLEARFLTNDEEQIINYGSVDSPLTTFEVFFELKKLDLAEKTFSPSYFFVSAKLKAAMVNGGSSYKFTLTDDIKDMDVSSAQVEDGKTEADYMAGDVLLVRAYARADSSKTNGFYLSYNNSGEDGKQAPQVLACTPPSVTGITLNPSEAFSLKAGAHKTINYTLAPEGAEGEVEWTVAPADGKLTVEDGYVTVANDAVAETVYTVTASVKNTALSASVQITIAAGTLEEQNVTIAPSDAEAIAESPFEIVKSGIKVSCTNGTITADQIRVFKGSTLTVSGAEIKSIVLTCTATGAAKFGPGSITATGYTFEAEGNTGTWTGLAEVVNLLASGNQARITSIVVTYLI